MVSNVYTYYLSQYGNRSVSKYDSHKKSDLKNTYNKILRINRDAPAYKIDLSEEAQKYAIDLKESAREFGNIASSLTGSENGDIVFTNCGGSISQTNGTRRMNIGGYVNSNWNNGLYLAEQGIILYVSSELTQGNFELFIEYTKTTDSVITN